MIGACNFFSTSKGNIPWKAMAGVVNYENFGNIFKRIFFLNSRSYGDRAGALGRCPEATGEGSWATRLLTCEVAIMGRWPVWM